VGERAFEIKLHQYVERDTGRVCTEEPFGDWVIRHLYSEEREEGSLLFRLLGSRWVSDLLRYLNYDLTWGPRISGLQEFLERCRIETLLADGLSRSVALNISISPLALRSHEDRCDVSTNHSAGNHICRIVETEHHSRQRNKAAKWNEH
jgi:hypothetical protein